MSGLATLLTLADGRLPAGGHAHSGGLEAAVVGGGLHDLAGLAAFLRGRLATTGRVGAAFTAAACAATTPAGPADRPTAVAAVDQPVATAGPADRPAATAGPADRPVATAGPADRPVATAGPADRPVATAGPADRPAATANPADRLVELDNGLDARTPAPAVRRASRVQGRALLRAGRALWSVDPAHRNLHHPVALGIVAAAAGLDPAEAAVAGAYGAISGPASAAVRLLGLDPYAVHALLAELAGECDRIAADAVTRIGDPVDLLPADSAPLLEIGAEIHASWEVRLFAS